MVESEEELKNLLMEVKEESEKAGILAHTHTHTHTHIHIYVYIYIYSFVTLITYLYIVCPSVDL